MTTSTLAAYNGTIADTWERSPQTVGDVPDRELTDMERSARTEQIWHEMHERLLGFITRRVATVHDAEDILQDVFIRIHASLSTLNDAESVTGWTYQIARNAITDYHRRRASSARTVQQYANHVTEAEPDDVTRDAVHEFSRCMEPLMSELPEPYAEALVLTDLAGTSQTDAAGQLGLSVPGMKSRVQRGRGKLKDVLLDCCNVEFDRRGGVVDYQRRNADSCHDCDCE